MDRRRRGRSRETLSDPGAPQPQRGMSCMGRGHWYLPLPCRPGHRGLGTSGQDLWGAGLAMRDKASAQGRHSCVQGAPAPMPRLQGRDHRSSPPPPGPYSRALPPWQQALGSGPGSRLCGQHAGRVRLSPADGLFFPGNYKLLEPPARGAVRRSHVAPRARGRAPSAPSLQRDRVDGRPCQRLGWRQCEEGASKGQGARGAVGNPFPTPWSPCSPGEILAVTCAPPPQGPGASGYMRQVHPGPPAWLQTPGPVPGPESAPAGGGQGA